MFESYGGLEPAMAITVVENRGSIVPRTTALTNPDVLRDAVKLAFDPYLPARGTRGSQPD